MKLVKRSLLSVIICTFLLSILCVQAAVDLIVYYHQKNDQDQAKTDKQHIQLENPAPLTNHPSAIETKQNDKNKQTQITPPKSNAESILDYLDELDEYGF